jgi:hypothetical protein
VPRRPARRAPLVALLLLLTGCGLLPPAADAVGGGPTGILDDAAAEEAVAAGERTATGVLSAARAELDSARVEPEYLELRSARDLSPADRVNGATLLAVAARVGETRLIDNTILGDP